MKARSASCRCWRLIGVGRVPLSLVLMILLILWGSIGFAAQNQLLAPDDWRGKNGDGRDDFGADDDGVEPGLDGAHRARGGEGAADECRPMGAKRSDLVGTERHGKRFCNDRCTSFGTRLRARWAWGFVSGALPCVAAGEAAIMKEHACRVGSNTMRRKGVFMRPLRSKAERRSRIISDRIFLPPISTLKTPIPLGLPSFPQKNMEQRRWTGARAPCPSSLCPPTP